MTGWSFPVAAQVSVGRQLTASSTGRNTRQIKAADVTGRALRREQRPNRSNHHRRILPGTSHSPLSSPLRSLHDPSSPHRLGRGGIAGCGALHQRGREVMRASDVSGRNGEPWWDRTTDPLIEGARAWSPTVYTLTLGSAASRELSACTSSGNRLVCWMPLRLESGGGRPLPLSRPCDSRSAFLPGPSRGGEM